MDKLKINGPNKLFGSLNISTSKNALLPILSACLLIDGKIVIQKFPCYLDAFSMLEILSGFGARHKFLNNDIVEIDCSNISECKIKIDVAQKIRSSFFTFGSVLARLGQAVFCYPGGCNIGMRPIDMHLKTFKDLGINISERHGYIYGSLNSYKGGEVYLDFPSVGATENIMLLACTLDGKTIIKNPAKEPEVVDLQNFLVKAGAKIFGAGTDEIIIYGVNKLLHSLEYTPITDRIVAGSYMIATAVCGGEVKLIGAKAEHNQNLIQKLISAGAKINIEKNAIVVKSKKKLQSIPIIQTQPYPYFATDLQPQMVVLQSVAKGNSLVVENIFESRLGYTAQLVKMGAKIQVKNNMAIITGNCLLMGAEVSAPDLRAGAGLVIAGLCASGYTSICGTSYIDRGYEHIERELSCLGANIVREK